MLIGLHLGPHHHPDLDVLAEPRKLLHGPVQGRDGWVAVTGSAPIEHGLGVDRRLVVILGGDGKGQDFAPLTAPVSRYARAVVLIGRDGKIVGVNLRGPALAEAVTTALAQPAGTAAPNRE